MRFNFLISILCVVNVLYGCLFAEAFGSLPGKTPLGLNSGNDMRKNIRSYGVVLFMEENSEEEKEIDSTLPSDVDADDLPMFTLEYNADNVDLSQLPVPPFTSAVIFIMSMAFTIYLYYVGITGGVATAPPNS